MLDSQSYQPANYLDSAILSSLRQLIDLHPALEQATGQLPRFDIVLDANIAIGDLLHKHQNPHLEQTALQEVVKSGVVRLWDPVGKAIRRLSYLTRDLIKRRKS